MGLMAIAVTAAAAVAGATCSVESPAHRVALVELYTSEGCESCPPADKFLGGLQASNKMVPLSLHVDYWNYLGWKDPYSRAAFTERQRWLSELGKSRAIYTPELFIAGREVRNWPGGVSAAVEGVNAMPAGADIALSAASGSAGLSIQVTATAKQPARLHVAITEDGVSSQVVAGENRGRLLRHEHVVREWLPPVAVPAGRSASLTQTVPLPRNANPDKLALVAFVQTEKGEILQAASLAACKR